MKGLGLNERYRVYGFRVKGLSSSEIVSGFPGADYAGGYSWCSDIE